MLILPVEAHKLLSRLLPPQSRVTMEPWPSCSLAAEWHQDLLWITPSSAPFKFWHQPAAGVSEQESPVPGTGTSWPRQSLYQPFPFCPCTVFSWPRTETQQASTGTSPWHTCRALRSPIERWPSSSSVSHSPRAPPIPLQLCPSPGCRTGNRF